MSILTKRGLFYQQNNAMWAVDVRLEPDFDASSPRPLFDLPDEMVSALRGVPGQVANYEVSADGRFLMVQYEPVVEPSEIRVVLNWTEELERVVPIDK